jgi:hypothetical protein
MSPYNDLPPFEAGSATSEAAALSMVDAASTLRERVFDLIASRGKGGTTDDEVEVALAMRHQTASARRRELELLGRVIKTGDRRPTRSGRTAAVYVTATHAPPAQGALFR